MAGFLGIVGFGLALFAAGAFAEGNVRKLVMVGAALLVCSGFIVLIGSPRQSSYADCFTDWDARSNASVCD